MATPLESKLRMEALHKGLSGGHADAYVSGALNRIHKSKGGTAIHPKRGADRGKPAAAPAAHKIAIPSLPGLAAGKKVSLSALMSPDQASPLSV